MNRATSATGWVRNPALKLPDLDPTQASSYDLGWTWNPLTGCLNHIKGLCNGGGFPCYAYKLANGRLRQRYLANQNYAPLLPMMPYTSDLPMYKDAHQSTDPFYPRLWEDRLHPLSRASPYGELRPRGIFACDMSDLFGIGVPEEWTKQVLEHIRWCSQHRFYLLTKQPQNLIKFSPFPDNCWVGVTITNEAALLKATTNLGYIDAKVKFISFEPLLERLPLPYYQMNCDWVIIGALTCKAGDILHRGNKYPELKAMPYGKIWTLQPKIEWVQAILVAAHNAGNIPVFMKDNLQPLLDNSTGWQGWKLRQEMPE